MSKRFWAGVIGGALLGMLYAKRSGKEVRAALVRATQKSGIKGGLTQLGKEIGGFGEELVGSVEEIPQVKQATREAEKTYTRNKRKASKALRKIRHILRERSDK